MTPQRSITREGAIRLGLGLLCFVHVMVRFVAWHHQPIGAGIDVGWKILLHEAWHRGWVYGEDFIFTHGPYGFMYANVLHPATYHLSLVLQSIFGGVIVAAVWRVASTAARNPFIVAALTLATLELMVEPHEGFYYNAILLILLLHWLPAENARGEPTTRAPALLLHLQVAAASVTAFVKFSFFVALALVMTSVCIDTVARQRRRPWIAVTYLASMLVLWLVANQPLRTFPLFLEISMKIAVGYGSAMSLPGPWQEPALFAATAGLLIALYGMILQPRLGLWALLPVATLAALLFVCGKGAYARQDGHVTIALSSLGPVAVLIAGWGWSQRRNRAMRALTLAMLVAVVSLNEVTLARVGVVDVRPAVLNYLYQTNPRKQLAAMAAVLTGRFDVDAEWDRATRRVRRAFPLRERPGTFDIYPFAQGLLVAHGFAHRPRPVFQSYKAYHPRLLRLNAEHLAAADGPHNVLFSIAPMDGKFPTLDDSLSLPILLSHFRLVGVESPFALFQRSPRIRSQKLELISSRRGRIGQTMPVPDPGAGCAGWAEIDVRPSALGRLRSLLYKIPEVYLDVQDGTSTARYRFVPDIGRAGFLLSPVIDNVEGLGSLARGQFGKLKDRRVRRLTLEVPDDPGLTYYEDEYALSFYCLQTGE